MKAKRLVGVKLGRPKGPGKSKLDIYRPEIEALLSHGSTQKFIAHRYKVTEATLFNRASVAGLRRTTLRKQASRQSNYEKIVKMMLKLKAIAYLA